MRGNNLVNKYLRTIGNPSKNDDGKASPDRIFRKINIRSQHTNHSGASGEPHERTRPWKDAIN